MDIKERPSQPNQHPSFPRMLEHSNTQSSFPWKRGSSISIVILAYASIQSILDISFFLVFVSPFSGEYLLFKKKVRRKPFSGSFDPKNIWGFPHYSLRYTRRSNSHPCSVELKITSCNFCVTVFRNSAVLNGE